MNIMPNSNLIAKKPNNNISRVIIVLIVVTLIVAIVLSGYYLYYSPKAKTTSLNRQMGSTAAQIAAIPNLDTKENIDKFNKLVDEFQVFRKQQEKLINTQLSTLK